MAYESLADFLEVLEAEGELLRIHTEVDPILEISEITDRISKAHGPALLFEKVRGSGYPLAINVLGSERRMAKALGVKDLEEMARRLFFEWFVNFRFPGHTTEHSVGVESNQPPNGWHETVLAKIADVNSDTISPRDAPDIIRYIENNPVTACVVTRPEEWQWSSASVGQEAYTTR